MILHMKENQFSKWCNNNRSPTTGKVLKLFEIYPNNDICSRCIEWKEIHIIK